LEGEIDFLGLGSGATAAVFALDTAPTDADEGGEADCVRFGLVERLDTGKSKTKSAFAFVALHHVVPRNLDCFEILLAVMQRTAGRQLTQGLDQHLRR